MHVFQSDGIKPRIKAMREEKSNILSLTGK